MIAEGLSITANRVRARVKRLTEEGVLYITGLVDPEAPARRVRTVHSAMITEYKQS
jgi:DNA-binding Lrp family transcriptional regulator